MTVELARRLLGQIELVGLSDTALEDEMERLVQKAQTPFGPVAAICVWPSFVSLCAKRLRGRGVRVATIVNFPKGGDDVERVISDAEEAADDGADEIDLVFPARSYVEGEEPLARSMIAEMREALPDDVVLKVLFEPQSFASPAELNLACLIAIEEGARFIKAGSGRGAPARPDQRAAMLEAIRETGKSCGLVISGPFADFAAMERAFEEAAEAVGEPWADAARFRLSSANALDILLPILKGGGA
jgi:deoxyribose-phosphate aldolase